MKRPNENDLECQQGFHHLRLFAKSVMRDQRVRSQARADLGSAAQVAVGERWPNSLGNSIPSLNRDSQRQFWLRLGHLLILELGPGGQRRQPWRFHIRLVRPAS